MQSHDHVQYQPFSVSVVPDRSEVIVVPAGELDMTAVDELDAEVRSLRRAGFDHVVIDLRQTGFIDSSGLRLLLSLRNSAERDGHRLTVIRGRAEVQKIFDLTATTGLFDWRDR